MVCFPVPFRPANRSARREREASCSIEAEEEEEEEVGGGGEEEEEEGGGWPFVVGWEEEDEKEGWVLSP